MGRRNASPWEKIPSRIVENSPPPNRKPGDGGIPTSSAAARFVDLKSADLPRQCPLQNRKPGPELHIGWSTRTTNQKTNPD